MTLRLQYKAETTIPVEVEGIVPDAVRDKSLSEIERWPIFHGNTQLPLAECFDVSGDPSDESLQWEGDLNGVHWIGAGMKSGTMHITGDAGRHVGSEIRGGQIHVAGNVGDWVGAEMFGGLIHVRGRCGHLPGSAYRGSARGMTGGTLLVEGDAGNEVGHSMRRGLLIVGGNAGDLVGFNMLAGSIFIGGESGIRHGACMRRGTIGFLGSQPPEMLPSFRRACRYRPDILRVIAKFLERLQFPVPDALLHDAFDLYHGDMIDGGRGEILLRAVPT
jgi:formylmethanofuran dehydrogenase subunit C